MNMRLLVCVVLVLLVLSLSEAAKKKKGRGKGRGRGRQGKGNDKCHLKEAEKCLDNMASFNKESNPMVIIENAAGLDKMCNAAKNEFVGCFKEFFKKCGTPLHREVSGLFLDQLTVTIDRICKPGPSRDKFLKGSPCISQKVMSQKPYKENCNNRYLTALDSASKREKKLNIETADIICCGYRYWEDCSKDLIKDSCGDDGIESFRLLITYGFMGMPDLTCPRDIFEPNSEECKNKIPTEGSKPKLNFGEAGISKYNVANMFGWMFTTD